MATVKKTSRNYVNSVLDAAAMASRADTLDGMLNQLPGLLMQQEQQKRAEETENERYNDEKTFRNTQYNDIVESRNYQEDATMVNILASLEGDEAIAFGNNISYKTEKGGNLGESVRKAKAVTVSNNNQVNTKIREFSNSLAGEPGKETLTYEQAQQEYDELELFLSEKGIKRDLNPLKKQIAVKQGREFGMNILDIVDFPNEDDLRSMIQTSNNPTEIVTFMVDRIDKQKLDAIENKKDKDNLLIDLGNSVSVLRNSGESESLIKIYEDKIKILSIPTEDGENKLSISERPLTQEDKKFLKPGEEKIIEDNGINYLYSDKTGTVRIVENDFELESDAQKLENLKKERRNAKTKKDLDKIDNEISKLSVGRGEAIQSNLEQQSFLDKEAATLPFYDIMSY